MKPMLIEGLFKNSKILNKDKNNILFETKLAMGDTYNNKIKDIVISIK